MPEAEQGMNVARIISLLSGLPDSISAATVNRFCASGLHAIADIAKSISVGQIDVGIGGGVESMSLIPMGGHKLSVNPDLFLKYPEAYTTMGITAENIANRFKIKREMQDQFALSSNKKAIFSIKNGYFKDEIIPISLDTSDNKDVKYIFNIDECPRSDTSLSLLSKLKPVFSLNGTVTAGNSSHMSDGAAASVLINGSKAKILQLPIMGYFRNFVTVGVPADIMGIGPVVAIKALLNKTGLTLSDIGVIELNEAFASQAIYCISALNLDENKVNPCGGAISLGHPLGCTGARQVATILREMKRRNSRYGICSMCVGGGMGAAALIELA
jgi:acetyl-CoA acyltransferase